VLRELATHPNREEIIRDNPAITKQAAHNLMREQKYAEEEQQHEKEEQENDWREHNRGWFRELYEHAQKVFGMVEVAARLTPEQQRRLLQVIEPLLLMHIGEFGRKLVDFVDHFEALLEEKEVASAKDVEAPIEPIHPEVIVQTTPE
jgi:hypothetical protein